MFYLLANFVVNYSLSINFSKLIITRSVTFIKYRSKQRFFTHFIKNLNLIIIKKLLKENIVYSTYFVL